MAIIYEWIGVPSDKYIQYIDENYNYICYDGSMCHKKADVIALYNSTKDECGCWQPTTKTWAAIKLEKL